MSSVDRLLVNNLKTSLQQSAHNVGSFHFDFVVCMKEGRREGGRGKINTTTTNVLLLVVSQDQIVLLLK